MAWVRLDDQFPDHPKVLEAGPLAAWLHVCGLAYCNRQLTDGFVPASILPRLSAVAKPEREAAKLVAVGLWDAVDGGWQIHDYLDFQPSRERVLAEREKAAARQRRARDKAASRRDSGVTHAVTSPEVRRESRSPRPDPTPNPLTSGNLLTSQDTGPERDGSVDNSDPSVRMALAGERLKALRGGRASAGRTDAEAVG